VITPSSAALISTVTLSVSTSATTSSAFTACPTAAVHSTMVPSVMLSPMVGTMTVLFSWQGDVAETKNLVAAAVVVANGRCIGPARVPAVGTRTRGLTPTQEEGGVRREVIERTTRRGIYTIFICEI
jgi:hypothetical protein